MTHSEEQIDLSVMLKELLNLQNQIRRQQAKRIVLTHKRDELKKRLRGIKNINQGYVDFMVRTAVDLHLKPRDFNKSFIDKMGEIKKTAQRMETIVGQITADQANQTKQKPGSISRKIPFALVRLSSRSACTRNALC